MHAHDTLDQFTKQLSGQQVSIGDIAKARILAMMVALTQTLDQCKASIESLDEESVKKEFAGVKTKEEFDAFCRKYEPKIKTNGITFREAFDKNLSTYIDRVIKKLSAPIVPSKTS